MAVTLFVFMTFIIVNYCPNFPFFSFSKRNIEEKKNKELPIKRSLQRALVIHSFDDIFHEKAERTKSIVIDNGMENQTWVYISKDKNKMLPKASGMLTIPNVMDVSGMSDQSDHSEDSTSEDESFDSEDEIFVSETTATSALTATSIETLFRDS